MLKCLVSYITVLRCGLTLQRKMSRSCRKFKILPEESLPESGNLIHITPVSRKLRWLPVTNFLKYTLGVLAFKCVKGLAPSYLCHRFKTGRIQNMDRGPWTTSWTRSMDHHGPPHGPGPWTTPNFQKEIAPVEMKIYRRPGYEKHRLLFFHQYTKFS